MYRIIIIDNYDSFTYNLYQQISSIARTAATVIRNDEISFEELLELSPTHLVISPGPGHPRNRRDFGVCSQILVSEIPIPILGVCLGHQGIAYIRGAKIVKAKEIVHGKTSLITHNSQGIFEGIPNPFKAGRYHSLAVYDPPSTIEVTATTAGGEVMGLQDTTYPRFGIQFHPESILTPIGDKLVKNFLKLNPS